MSIPNENESITEIKPIDPTLHETLLSGWFKHETGELFTGFAI